MEVNDELVDKLANLARLEFGADEKASIKEDLRKMIGFIESLGQVDTTGIEPLLHMTGEVNVLRDDIVEGQITAAAALQNAPEHDRQFFLVPKVIRNS